MICKSHILVIEDDPDIRDILKYAIEMEGYKVVTASNGKEGLEYVQKSAHPCLILLDLMMPVMDGWTFSENVSSDQDLKKIPVVVVSAYSDRVKSVKNYKDFITKPIDFDVLIKTVGQYCEEC